MRSTLPAVLAIAGLAVLPASSPAKTTVFKVTKATHSSSSSKTETTAPFYNGSSSASWSLAKATSEAPNRLSLQSGGAMTTGLGRVNVKGVFSGTAQTRDNAPCSLSAPTGSSEYPAVAPSDFDLQVQNDPKGSKRLAVTFNGKHATLGNPYFGSECSTAVSGEPDFKVNQTTLVPKSRFKSKTVTLKWSGSTSDEGIAYRWSTTIVLKRLR